MRALVLWAGFALVLMLLPRVFDSVLGVSILNQMAIAIVFALSYNLLLGQGGMLSFGHAVYFGLGGFLAVHAMLLTETQTLAIPLVLIPLVGGVCGLVSFGLTWRTVNDLRDHTLEQVAQSVVRHGLEVEGDDNAPDVPDKGQFTSQIWTDDGQLQERAQVLRDRLGLAGVLVTRSEEGMTLFDSQGRLDVAAQVREVFDVTGAGDTVIATLATMLAAGMPLRDAVLVANRAAGIVVGKFGTASASLQEIFT